MAGFKLKYVIFICLIFLGSGGCATLKPLPPQPEVLSLTPASTGILNKISLEIQAVHGQDLSAFMLLTRNDDALNYRLALIDHAVQSIDAQYFIWQADETGGLLLDRLLRAADRGIRVRLLVDDFPLAAKNRDLALLSHHPNFEMKIFNPNYARGSTLGGLGKFLLNFKEMNRRMHNKLFVVDGQMAIVGGRNIGNPYFGLSKKYNFRDLDVLVAGAVTRELSQAFDQYWNARLAYPASAMAEIKEGEGQGKIRQAIADFLEDKDSLLMQYPLYPKNWEKKLALLPVQMKPGEAHFIQDKPVVVHGEELRLMDMLDYISRPSHEELLIATPYLIPVDNYQESLIALSSAGVTVKIITNTLGSNNHTMAHSHYKKYRKKILATGTDLYEFRHDPSKSLAKISNVPPVEADFISLHIKAMVADRKNCFIGSLNFDPRALKINTENGLYIESEALALELAHQFDRMMAPENAWQVYMNKENELRWKSRDGSVSSQPARSFGQRISDFFYRLLPIESQL